MGYLRFDDYVEKGTLTAIKVIQEISKVPKVNVFGYCLGGTLLGASLAVLASRKEETINSVTFLATMLDFSDIGPMGDIVDEDLVNQLQEKLHKGGIMPGHEMEMAFNFLRPNDLIWNYFIDNYLKGKKPNTSDVNYWTNDNTNLPGNMCLYYLKELVLQNRLSKRNATTICGAPINLKKVKTPAMVIGLDTDHISPSKTTFTTTELLGGEVEFILGGSGHVMGAINHPSRNKYGYATGGELDEGFEHWKLTSEKFPGSWWTPWSQWLTERSGGLRISRNKLGNRTFKEIVAAPGTYVLEKHCK